MTNKSIEDIAKESQLMLWQAYCDKKMELESANDEIERLRSKIKDAVEAERESCAMIAEQHGFLCECDAAGTAYKAASEHIASTIRKREKDD